MLVVLVVLVVLVDPPQCLWIPVYRITGNPSSSVELCNLRSCPESPRRRQRRQRRQRHPDPEGATVSNETVELPTHTGAVKVPKFGNNPRPTRAQQEAGPKFGTTLFSTFVTRGQKKPAEVAGKVKRVMTTR